MNKRRRLTLEIALSGISAALALICIVLFYYIPLGSLSFLALSGVSLMLPLCMRKERGCVLAYLAAGGLGIAAATPLAVVPYALLFGWQPVVMGLCEHYLKGKPYLSIPLKAGLFNAGLYGVYVLYGLGDPITNALARVGWNPAYWAIALVGTALWIGYDYLMQGVWRWLQSRLKPILTKYEPNEQREDTDKDNQQETSESGKASEAERQDDSLEKDDPFAEENERIDAENGDTYPPDRAREGNESSQGKRP